MSLWGLIFLGRRVFPRRPSPSDKEEEMRKLKAFFLALVGISFGVGLFGAEMTLESSTFIPDPGSSVSLFVRRAPVGAT